MPPIETTVAIRGNASFGSGLVLNEHGRGAAVFPRMSARIQSLVVAVAQLVRASVCGTEGRGFEPRQPPLSHMGRKTDE